MPTLTEKLGHTFRDPSLLRLALTHATLGLPNNQRLEFLGDAVLEYLISDLLYRTQPNTREGDLTFVRQRMVSEAAMSPIAQRLGLGEALLVSPGEDALRGKPSVLCDTLEAVLAAVYLDGGLEAARSVVERYWPSPEEITRQAHGTPRDAKSLLNEFCSGLTPPETAVYELMDQQGPPHSPVFTMRVCVDGTELARGTGSTKKAAEQTAAAAALAVLRNQQKTEGTEAL